YALDGLQRTMSVVEHIQKGMNPNLGIAGILMLSVTNDEVGRESLAQLRASYANLMFRTAIPYDVDVVKATYRRMPVTIFSPEGRTAGRFLALAAEIIDGRGHAASEADLKPAMERIRAWHADNNDAYAGAQRPSPAGDADDTPGNGAAPARSRSGLALAMAVVGLVAGFALGTVAGQPILGAVMAALNG
ncbi:MAG TPA: chromosome partitioning protein, partial [Azospirillum sp.]|nr:chromosome partitioning protein [Azospirillum sp.]